MSWTASTGAGWLSISTNAGAGQATIRVEAGANTTVYTRATTVTAGGQTVSVSQGGLWASVSTNRVTLPPDGGSVFFDVSAEGGAWWQAVTRTAARVARKRLVDAGVWVPTLVGRRRGREWSSDELVVLLDRFEKDLGLGEMKVLWQPLDAADRIAAVASGRVDVECGTTTATLTRMKAVDFSLPIFVDGGSVLVIAEPGVDSLAELVHRKHWRAKPGANGQGSKCHGRAAEDLIMLGKIADRQGNQEAVGQAFEQAMTQFPQEALAYLEMAGHKLRGGDDEAGGKLLGKGLSLAPRSGYAYALCCALNLVEGKTQQAGSALHQALELDPEDELANLLRNRYFVQ